MALITQHDFETKAGRGKIVRTIHSLESKVHELEKKTGDLTRAIEALENDLEGPEAY